MEDAAEDPTRHRDWHSILRAKGFWNHVSRSRQPAADSPHYQPTKQADQPAEEECVRLAMHRVVTAQQVVSRLKVDDDLFHRIRRYREVVRSNRLDEKARSEVERSRRHYAPANLSGCRHMMRGVAGGRIVSDGSA